jgi:hypothetical protein
MHILEEENTAIKDALKPIREKQDIYIPGIKTENIPKRNGFISLYVGSPGSGKSSLLYSMLGNKAFYKKKFHHIFYFCPHASFISVVNHPLKELETIHHELSAQTLDAIYEDRSRARVENDEADEAIEYACIVIDDFGSELKNPDIVAALKRIMIKSRHICTALCLTAQSYLLVDASLRKLLSNIIMFKPSTEREWSSLCDEHLPHLDKPERVQLHRFAFAEPYSHLDVDTKEAESNAVSRNFNRLHIQRK